MYNATSCSIRIAHQQNTYVDRDRP